MLELAFIGFLWGVGIGWFLIFMVFVLNEIIDEHEKG
jgi:hypothetical protein